jgi:hypothetical protein
MVVVVVGAFVVGVLATLGAFVPPASAGAATPRRTVAARVTIAFRFIVWSFLVGSRGGLESDVDPGTRRSEPGQEVVARTGGADEAARSVRAGRDVGQARRE